MSARTPVTPLPWTIASVYQQGTVGFKNATFISTGVPERDTAYILHAANAYPQLVEALRCVAIGKPYAKRAAELLRTLGEQS